MSSSYFLGVDGGQSSTTVLIGDGRGRVLGQGRAGPCNHAAADEGRLKLTNALTAGLAEACANAGLDAGAIEFASACLGFSGGAGDKRDLVARIVRAAQIEVTNDGWIALAGATAGAPGVVVIAGTGSLAVGRNGAGKMARAGGWGYIFGDEGGGIDIARQAVRAILRMEEGWGEATTLHAMLLDATGASNANALLHALYTPDWPRPRMAKLARLVDEAAGRGDALAQRIMDNAARSLAQFALAVRGQLFSPGETVIVSYIGGVFRSRRLLERFRAAVPSQPPIHGPAAGALLEAYRLAGLSVALANLPDEKP